MLRILVVEDETRQRVGITRLLKSLEPDAKIFEAANGLDALCVCEKEYPDLLITDVKMPVMDGMTLIEKLAKRGKPIYTVIISAYEEFENARRALRLNVKDYLTKPVSRQAVKALLENAKKESAAELSHLPAQRPGESEPAQECLQYIIQHYDEDISLDELAARFNFNPSYLSVLIKQHTGMTFSKHITRLRVNRACELLANSGEHIQAVSEQVGYRDASYFIRVFKTMMGVSPSRYRRLHAISKWNGEPEE
jgi:YesN/AraC family two-component response regulator